MKRATYLFVFVLVGALCNLNYSKAQVNLTNLITNPSFETGNYTGWTWTGRTGGWETVNTDGDASKNGTYIAGYWNNNIGDVECSQTLTGLTNGYYKITALATVSTNRTTTQRLFANNNSTLFGANNNAAYTPANLSIIGTTETYSFAGYAESTAENGPFKLISVVTKVTDGNLKFGFRLNGKGTALGYDFSYSPKADAGFFKFDNFTLTEVSNVTTLSNITLSAGTLSPAFHQDSTVYNAILPVGTTTVTPTVYISVDGQTISGNSTVDVSSGSGVSNITVTAPDGISTKVYKINYKVLTISNDATLKSLSTNVGSLVPAFSPSILNYTVSVPIGTTSVIPTAVKNDEKSSITGNGEVTLVKGKGISKIIVTAENGESKTYTITYVYAYVTNPSFETGNLIGWTWTGTSGYAWLGPNTDGDATKNGSYICGIWNAPIGDAECSQTITGLPNGYYRVSALATVSMNRTTNQRLFANTSSKLYGAKENDNYSAANLAILTSLGENFSFGGYEESNAENGPFKPLSVVTQVTSGTLKFGFRVSGSATTKGFAFTSVSGKNDIGFFKFDNFAIDEVSDLATLDNITLSTGALDAVFDSNTTTYSASLPLGTKKVFPAVVASVEGATVTGADTVDVSGGSGVSTITVTSIDGSATKTYTINYTVLTTSPYEVSSYTTDTAGINFKLKMGMLRLHVCSDKIIHIAYSLNDTIVKKDSIVVNKVWGKPSFTVTEDADFVIITTQELTVKVSKTSSLVSYYNKQGNPVLSEDSKLITAATILGINTNKCSATFNSPITEGIYGLGQHQQKVMNYKSKTVMLDQQNTEIALPFMITTRGYGILWDNYSLTNFKGNVASNTKYQFSSESGKMVDYYFIYGPELNDVIAEYRTATGAAPLFPKWAYGLFQSRDKYTSSTELLDYVKKYRAANIALDCIVQDWDYWTPDLWGSHTMDASRYPNPKALIDSLHARNVHSMISIWPVFHSSTTNYQQFNAIGALYPSSGAHHFYDPHNEAAKKIYWNQVNSQLFTKYGWDAWWADNDEPQGYPDGFDRKNFITAKGPGVTYYNTYPIEHTSAVYNGWRQDIPEKRLFTLSRSAFSGQQRYATAAWSGDISSDWGAFQRQLSAGLNFCMSGIPYWTTDIGGYTYTDWSTTANQELMIRWFQYGAFCPIFRIHGQGEKALVSSTFTQSTKDNLKLTNRLRYRLMPYIYSNAWKVTNEGYTMMRHLVMDYQTDANVKSIDNQFMFGQSMMINPVSSAGITSRSVYLPDGNWYDFWTGVQYTGNQTITATAPISRIPVFVKAGSIIPMGPEIMYATQSIDPIEVRVYRGADGNFKLYEDEGDSYNYEKGSYSIIPFSYNETSRELTIGTRTGSYTNMPVNRNFKIVWVAANYGIGIDSPAVCDTLVKYDGSAMVIPAPVTTGFYNPENRLPDCTFYPNPANDLVNISFNSAASERIAIKFIDLNGKCVYRKNWNTVKGANLFTINTKQNHMGSGVYYVAITTGKEQYTHKFILK